MVDECRNIVLCATWTVVITVWGVCSQDRQAQLAQLTRTLSEEDRSKYTQRTQQSDGVFAEREDKAAILDRVAEEAYESADANAERDMEWQLTRKQIKRLIKPGYSAYALSIRANCSTRYCLEKKVTCGRCLCAAACSFSVRCCSIAATAACTLCCCSIILCTVLPSIDTHCNKCCNISLYMQDCIVLSSM